MLIIALVLAVVGLAALVTAVVTGNALIAWVCIAASVVGVVLLIIDAVRERSRGGRSAATGSAAAGDSRADDAETTGDFDADYPDEPEGAESFALDSDADFDADTRAVPYDERHEDQVGADHPGADHPGADHPEEPTTR
ncbi:phage holin family protein [Mycolicibacterium litorale]|uniref:Transmembrane protein n=1 Tax=Mycolicibacterium litorale TaxID=758802 RepID=A0AAD1IHN8_9MYCO|nr:phage holin family protein [Mycolicibacterium litorale]MCV7414379.1 phage holin family protein [Mycolicibacterium litorale]TDY01363.1 hypothetical protein BCL50_4841 [Mycolicibacterium litorale]BBY15424.1 hypothetical protein MLIT_10160 [Mycolicibacterium litorale]